MVPAQLKQISNFRRGFTLVELLVVIGLIGVLASITFAVINPLTQFQKARDAGRKNDLANIQKALELFYNDNNRYPTTTEIPWGALWSNYMQRVPKDTSGRTYRYEQELSGQAYQLYAGLERCTSSSNCHDNQACSGGSACSGVAAGGNCGSGITCTYGVSSSNTTP